MPSTTIERRILRVIAANRRPEDHAAGGIVLDEGGRRIPSELDIFADGEERLRDAASIRRLPSPGS